MATLIFLDDDKGEETYQLKPEGTTIGRETDNDIILQEGEISRHHARVVEKDGEWVFKDLGSGLGTTVNDEPVKDSEQVLIPGDLIVMGRHKFKFEPGVSDVTIMGGLEASKPEDIAKAKAEEEKKPAEKTEAPKESPYDKEEATAEEPEPVKEEEPAKEEAPKPAASASAPAPKKKGGGGLLGCGGCGCFLAVILLIGGLSMFFIGSNNSHVDELIPWGIGASIFSGLPGLIALILIIIGMSKKKKK